MPPLNSPAINKYIRLFDWVIFFVNKHGVLSRIIDLKLEDCTFLFYVF